MTTDESFTYPKPPILEAVIEVVFAHSASEKELAAADRRLDKDYAVHEDVVEQTVRAEFKLDKTQRVTAVPGETSVTKGHSRRNITQDELVILKPNSVLVSQLAPYKSWNHYFARFQKALRAYVGRKRSWELKRVGMRYINRIDIPVVGEIVPHEQYLTCFPSVPMALGDLLGYNMHVTVASKAFPGGVTIRTAPAPSPTLNHAAFMLDIDAFQDKELPMNEDRLFSLLQSMRIEKNMVFEACVTDLARETIFGLNDAAR